MPDLSGFSFCPLGSALATHLLSRADSPLLHGVVVKIKLSSVHKTLKLCLASHSCSEFVLLVIIAGNVNEHSQQVRSQKDLQTAPEL